MKTENRPKTNADPHGPERVSGILERVIANLPANVRREYEAELRRQTADGKAANE